MAISRSRTTPFKKHLYRLEEELGTQFGWKPQSPLRDAIIRCVKLKADRLGFDELTYYNTVLGDPAEIMTLAEEVADQETAFFREPTQFASLRDSILPTLVKANRTRRRLRIWSVGCSTGEEAYSLALLVNERLAQIGRWEREILATDFRGRALLDANAVVYPAEKLGNLSEAEREKYFKPVSETGQFRLATEIKHMVSFRRGNIVEPGFWRQIKKGYDLILCCNLLSCLQAGAAQNLIGHLADSIRPGGYLMVAPTEGNLVSSKQFESVETTGLLVRTDPTPS